METKERIKEEQTRTRSRQKPQKDVVYTQPKPFNRNRFLLQMATAAAVALALLLGISIFFKVEQVEVAGAEHYDEYRIFETSGIEKGESLMLLNKMRIKARIEKENPYVDTVRIGRRLPDTVVIQITERDVFYAAQDSQGGWWLLNPNGKIVENCPESAVDDHTKILGVKLSAPEPGMMAAAYEPEQEQDEEGNTIPVTVYAKEQLELALTIIRQLEKEHFVGTIASVDVSNTSDIQLWYGTRFQMLIGDAQKLSVKINALSQALDMKEDYETGILDASFTIWPDQVAHSQFP